MNGQTAGVKDPPRGQEDQPPVIIREDPKKIARSPFNRQVDIKSDAGKELIESIRTHGIIQPLVVRPGANGKPYELIAGERRWRAAMALQLEDVPIIVKKVNDTEAIELQIAENKDREDLSPIEEAEKYQQLLDQYAKEKPPVTGDAAIKRLSDRVSRSKSAIYESLRLLKLAEPVKEKINAGALPASHAGLIAQLPLELQNDVVVAIAPNKKLAPKEAQELDEKLGIAWHDRGERDEQTGLIPFRQVRDIIDAQRERLADLQKYEAKAAAFRKNGGTALSDQDAQKEKLLCADDYLTEFCMRVSEAVKAAGTKDLPKQIMRPDPRDLSQPEMVWRVKELLPALRKAGVKMKTYSGGSTADYQKRERARQAKERTQRALLGKILEPLRAGARKRTAKIPWALFLNAIANYGSVEYVCKSRGWPFSYQNHNKVLKEKLPKVPENQMAGIIAEILVAEFTAQTGTYKPELVELANFYGVDAKAIAKKAREEHAKQTSGKPTKAKAKATKPAKKKKKGGRKS